MPRVKKWEPKSSYFEFYKDPRWQKKRLEVMQRDGFKCRSCDSTIDILNVHHCYYEDGKKPWEYTSASLVTLCESCHEHEKDQLKESRKSFLSKVGSMGYGSIDYEYLEGVVSIFKRIYGDQSLNMLLNYAAEAYDKYGFKEPRAAADTESFVEYQFMEERK